MSLFTKGSVWKFSRAPRNSLNLPFMIVKETPQFDELVMDTSSWIPIETGILIKRVQNPFGP